MLDFFFLDQSCLAFNVVAQSSINFLAWLAVGLDCLVGSACRLSTKPNSALASVTLDWIIVFALFKGDQLNQPLIYCSRATLVWRLWLVGLVVEIPLDLHISKYYNRLLFAIHARPVTTIWEASLELRAAVAHPVRVLQSYGYPATNLNVNQPSINYDDFEFK
jgi:hypothetical protein